MILEYKTIAYEYPLFPLFCILVGTYFMGLNFCINFKKKIAK